MSNKISIAFSKRDGWVLDVPATLSDTGKRKRKCFKTKTAAQEAAKEYSNRLKVGGNMQPEDQARLDRLATLEERVSKLGTTIEGALHIFEKLMSYKLETATPMQAIEYYKDLERLAYCTGKSPRQAMQAYVTAWRHTGKDMMSITKAHAAEKKRLNESKTLKQGIRLWKRSYKDLRERSKQSYDHTSARLMQIFSEDTKLATFTHKELEKRLKAAGGAYKMHRTNTLAFFSFLERQEPPLITTEHLKYLRRMALPDKKEAKEISVMKPREVMEMLHTLEMQVRLGNLPSRVVTYHALAAFAGIRVEEIGKLRKEDFKQDGIELGASITKKGKRRFVNYTPQLRTWLEAYPHDGEELTRYWLIASRALLGYDIATEKLNDELKKYLADNPRPNRGKWKQNILRHTHASAAIAGGATLEALLFQFGHTGSHDTLRAHYAGIYSKTNAQRYHSIQPKFLGFAAVEAMVDRMVVGGEEIVSSDGWD